MQEIPSRQEIWKMFDEISPTYDRVNRIMTYGLDRYWRKKVGAFLPNRPLSLLDLATGTGDQIISLLENCPQIQQAIGTDLSKEMLLIGQKKITQKSYQNKVTLEEGNALSLPYPDSSFDCITMSFGIRNVTNVVDCLKEMMRLLKPGGRALILEGTVPSIPLIRQSYLFYMRHILPRIGAAFAKNPQAYQYLNKTIETFPSGDAFCQLMREAGFSQSCAHPLTLGTVTIYQGDKS